MRSVVVFPAPLGPRNPVTVPSATSKLRSSTARTSPNRLVSDETVITMGSLRDGRDEQVLVVCLTICVRRSVAHWARRHTDLNRSATCRCFGVAT